MKYLYLKDGKWEEHDKPLKGKQYGFFATRTDKTFGEAHWGDGNTIRRGFSDQSLFGWLHDNVFIPFWGDIGIFEINKKGEPLFERKVFDKEEYEIKKALEREMNNLGQG